MPIREKLHLWPDPARYIHVPRGKGEYRSPGRFFNRIITLFRHGLKKDGRLDISVLKNLGLQKDYPLRKLIRSGFQWQHDPADHMFRFRIEIPETHGALLRKNKQASGYRFTIILVYGSAMQEGKMQLKKMVSKEYPFSGTGKTDECLLELPYTPEPGMHWLFCLRAECMAGGKIISYQGSRALQVLDEGKWEQVPGRL